MEKIKLRKTFRALREGMTRDELDDISRKISDFFLKSDLYRDSDEIFIYLSMDKEIDTSYIIKKALDDNKKVYVPKIEKDYLKCARVLSVDDLIDGKFNIKTSRRDEFINDPDLSLVPGLAFDPYKNRLGLGGGFYDRFLDTNKTISIGLFAKYFMAKRLPTDDFDKKLTYIITEDGFL